jgi:putative endonuclease
MWNYNFFVYITSNYEKTVLYVGVTNDLVRRLYEHKENKGDKKTFAGKYYCYNLVYYERFSHIEHAIEREKEIKNGAGKRKML